MRIYIRPWRHRRHFGGSTQRRTVILPSALSSAFLARSGRYLPSSTCRLLLRAYKPLIHDICIHSGQRGRRTCNVLSGSSPNHRTQSSRLNNHLVTRDSIHYDIEKLSLMRAPHQETPRIRSLCHIAAQKAVKLLFSFYQQQVIALDQQCSEGKLYLIVLPAPL